ncbi:MAG: hypothetical protein AB1422_19110 [bacterium]
MFSPTSKKSVEQAHSLLLQNGEQFNLAVGLKVDVFPNLYLVYVTTHSETHNPEEGISQIRSELSKAGFKPVRTGVIGIDFYQERVYLRNNYGQGEIPELLKKSIGEGIMLQQIFPDDDLFPLFYIPWDPNISQSDDMANYCEQTFCERILTEIVCGIGRMTIPGIIEFEYD